MDSDLLNYGTFARALLDVYRRIREPLFGQFLGLASRLGLAIEIMFPSCSRTRAGRSAPVGGTFASTAAHVGLLILVPLVPALIRQVF